MWCPRRDLHKVCSAPNPLVLNRPHSLIFGYFYFRFVIGEIAAAILSVHELGLAFNDLKPENVLITAMGHIKVWCGITQYTQGRSILCLITINLVIGC